jgi:hypothetical protein
VPCSQSTDQQLLVLTQLRLPQLFFAKVLRSASEDDVKGLFCQFGKVYDVNLFRAFQGAPTTKVPACPRRGR